MLGKDKEIWVLEHMDVKTKEGRTDASRLRIFFEIAGRYDGAMREAVYDATRLALAESRPWGEG